MSPAPRCRHDIEIGEENRARGHQPRGQQDGRRRRRDRRDHRGERAGFAAGAYQTRLRARRAHSAEPTSRKALVAELRRSFAGRYRDDALMHMLMMPRLGQTMTTGKLVEWLIDVGQAYQEGSLIYTIETDKTVLEVEANLPGVLLRRLVEPDEEVPVGAQVGISADIGEAATEDQIAQFLEANASEPENEAQGETAVAPSRQGEESAPRAMPNVRSRAKELGVDLAELSRVTGKTGTISKQDVEDFAAQRGSAPQKPPVSPRARSLQSAMAKRMSESWLVPQFTQDVEIEIGPLRAKRERLAAEGLKISFASFILDALTKALTD